MVLLVKNQLANAGDIRDEGSIPGWEDLLEESKATHGSILAHGQRSLAGFSQWSCKELNTTQQQSTHTYLSS